MNRATIRTTGYVAALGLLGCALAAGLPAPLGAQQPAKAAEAKQEPVRKVTNLRDPFRSLLARPDEAGGPQALPPGKRGLVIPQLSVDGIVILPSERIAVVNMRGRNRAYFLRERDEVYNGYVARITEDSVVFRERATDAFGRSFERDVVKTITGPGAQR